MISSHLFNDHTVFFDLSDPVLFSLAFSVSLKSTVKES